MMQANELRIGNLLNYDTPEGDVVTLTTDFGAIQWATEDPKGFNLVHTPIQLTEEWLINFRFEKQPNYWRRLSICNEWTYIYWEKLIGVEICVNKHSILLPHVKYVHQLQNLYFALTGQELTIKN